MHRFAKSMMMLTIPLGLGCEIAPNELWMLVVGPSCLTLAIVYEVFRPFKNGMRPHPKLKLSPMSEKDSMHKAQEVMHRGQLATNVPIPCFGATLLQHSSQFIMKFPMEAWTVNRRTNQILINAAYLPMSAAGSEYAPTHWGEIRNSK